ncbi:hypothetical protein FHR85_000243 [Alkalibacillus almallahensis]|nr:hypothetical protein [Alkalibacillus almallahensis]
MAPEFIYKRNESKRQAFQQFKNNQAELDRLRKEGRL